MDGIVCFEVWWKTASPGNCAVSAQNCFTMTASFPASPIKIPEGMDILKAIAFFAEVKGVTTSPSDKSKLIELISGKESAKTPLYRNEQAPAALMGYRGLTVSA